MKQSLSDIRKHLTSKIELLTLNSYFFNKPHKAQKKVKRFNGLKAKV